MTSFYNIFFLHHNDVIRITQHNVKLHVIVIPIFNVVWILDKDENAINTRTGDTGEGGGSWPPHFFCVGKRKKRDKAKKERFSKQKVLKGCHQDQSIIVLAILERLEFQNFSCQPTLRTILFSVLWVPYFKIHFAGPG